MWPLFALLGAGGAFLWWASNEPVGSRVVSPYGRLVREVVADLTKTHGRNSFTFSWGLSPTHQRADARIGGPAPMVEPIRAAVRRAVARHARDPHTLVTEGRTSPGAVGEGWYISLIEQPSEGHVH